MDIALRTSLPIRGLFDTARNPLAGGQTDGASSFASTLRGMAAADVAQPSGARGYNDTGTLKAFSQMPLAAPVSIDFERTEVVHRPVHAMRDFPSKKQVHSPGYDAGLTPRNASPPNRRAAQVSNVVLLAFEAAHSSTASVQRVMSPSPEIQNIRVVQTADPRSVPQGQLNAKSQISKHLSWLTGARERLHVQCVGNDEQVNITVRVSGLTDRDQQHLRTSIEQMALLKGLTIEHLRITALGRE